LATKLFDEAHGENATPLRGTDGVAHMRLAESFDGVENVTKIAMLQWDTDTLSWVKFTGGTGGGGSSGPISVTTDSIEVRSFSMKSIVDEASSTVTYVGEASTGTAVGAASWRIKRLTQAASVLTIEWADGNGNFDNVWSDRASLSYS